MFRRSRVSLASAAAFVTIAQVAGGQELLFRTGVELVNLGVTVTDRRGELITDLTMDDFEIVEDGRTQAIRYFARGLPVDPGPDLRLGLLLDVSESMSEDLPFTRTAAIKFLNTLTDAVDVTVVDFDTEVRVARYSQREYARLIERIRQQKARGSTALYDAIGVYLDGAAGQQGRKIMLLYTDGGDTRSSIRYGELRDLVRASDVTIYVIGALDHQSASSRASQRMLLQQIAETTGGQAFFPSSTKDLDSAYDRVLERIRAQYTIGYQSTNAVTDGAWRKVEIRVLRRGGRDYRIGSRNGYFGPYKRP